MQETRRVREAPAQESPSAARKRAAVETIAREGSELRRVARRFSLCAADADDAYQRALEILLTKAPSDRPRDLARWMRIVVKHEALAVRRGRERLLGTVDNGDGGAAAARVPAPEDGPELRAEELEDVARSREALRLLKPAELRSLALLAAGCTYAEIAAITGYSTRKMERSLVEGRERFRRLVTRGEDGSRCAEMGPLLSAFCDGEARPAEAAAVREHLRACAGCRATLRAYRAAPAAAAALAPALPLSRSLLERAQELFAGIQARLPGFGAAGDGGMAQVAAAGGGRGLGVAATAKLLALCAGTVGGAACVATGVAPAPLDLAPREKEARVERVAEQVVEPAPSPVEYEPAPEPPPIEPEPEREPAAPPEEPAAEPAPAATEAGAVEYEAPPPAAPSAPASGNASDSAAGEFGP